MAFDMALAAAAACVVDDFACVPDLSLPAPLLVAGDFDGGPAGGALDAPRAAMVVDDFGAVDAFEGPAAGALVEGFEAAGVDFDGETLPAVLPGPALAAPADAPEDVLAPLAAVPPDLDAPELLPDLLAPLLVPPPPPVLPPVEPVADDLVPPPVETVEPVVAPVVIEKEGRPRGPALISPSVSWRSSSISRRFR
ncbi:MAG TPA: hypothetical protein VK196_15495 [Magnetospirillum sp.]|nr:hypothetical protein [Magnetospirillum sp.]